MIVDDGMALVSHIFAQNSSVNFSIVGGDGMDNKDTSLYVVTQDWNELNITQEDIKAFEDDLINDIEEALQPGNMEE